MKSGEHVVLAPVGRLDSAAAVRLRVVLGKHLGQGRPVLVDLAGIESGPVAGLTVFAAALRSAGGWPVASLVLFGGAAELAASLRSGRLTDTVPLVATLADARARSSGRPDVVRCRHPLPRHRAASGSARVLVRTVGLAWSVPFRLREVAALLAGELVGNAVAHARTRSELSLELDDRWLRVRVRDWGTGVATQLPPASGGVGTSGLGIVSALALEWGTTAHVDGKTVWAVLSAARS